MIMKWISAFLPAAGILCTCSTCSAVTLSSFHAYARERRQRHAATDILAQMRFQTQPLPVLSPLFQPQVFLAGFPLTSARRASGCPSGMEWRYAKLGGPTSSACSCPANSACMGPTNCTVTPAADELWQVVQAPPSPTHPPIPPSHS